MGLVTWTAAAAAAAAAVLTVYMVVSVMDTAHEMAEKKELFITKYTPYIYVSFIHYHFEFLR